MLHSLHSFRVRVLLAAFLLIAAVLRMVLIFSGDMSDTDLPAFYMASVGLFHLGVSPYNQPLLQSLFPYDQIVYPFLYPPPSLLLFYPLSLLTYEQAIGAMLWANIISFGVAVALILRNGLGLSLGRDAARIGVALLFIIAFDPFYLGTDHGQVSNMVLLTLVLYWVCAQTNRSVLAGLFLALAVLIKTYPILFLPFLLLNRRFREAAATTLWLVFFAVVGLVVVPVSVWRDWWEHIVPAGSYGRMPAGLFPPSSIWNQSLSGVFMRLWTENEWQAPLWVDPGLAVQSAYMAAILVVLTTTAVLWRARHRSPDRTLSAMMLVVPPMTFLIAPFSWSHHLVYLLPSFALLAHPRYEGLIARNVHLLLMMGIGFVCMSRFQVPWLVWAVLGLWLTGLWLVMQEAAQPLPARQRPADARGGVALQVAPDYELERT